MENIDGETEEKGMYGADERGKWRFRQRNGYEKQT